MALAVKIWSMRLMDGRKVARRIRAEVAEGVVALRRCGVEPGLGVVLVGDDPASAVYVGMKERASGEAGIRSVTRRLPADATREDVLRVVGASTRIRPSTACWCRPRSPRAWTSSRSSPG